jgi:DNA-binding transcriptional LysR family regulator
VVTNDGLVDIVAGGFDAGIRPGPLLGQAMIAITVGPRAFIDMVRAAED